MNLIIFEEKSDIGSPLWFLGIDVLGNNERGTWLRFPDILIMIIMLKGDNNLVSNQICKVETNSQIICQI